MSTRFRRKRTPGRIRTCVRASGKSRKPSGRHFPGGDSRGMTLLELIIAVAIFSVASLTLLQAFVTSGRINKKSGLYLDASTAAQNVMEEIKARSITDLAADYLDSSDGSDDSRYSLVMEGVECSGETFDVLAVLDGSEDTSYGQADDGGSDSKNDYEMPNIAKLDSKTSGLLMIPQDWGQGAADAWAKTGKISAADAESVVQNMKKTVTVTLEEKDGAVTAKACYDFEYQGNTYSGKELTFFSTDPGNALTGIYLFYYPNYNSSGSGTKLDNFVFDNKAGLAVSFYVIKQSRGEDETVQEQNYQAAVTVKEVPADSGWDADLSTFRAQTSLRSNLSGDSQSAWQLELAYEACDEQGTIEKTLTGAEASAVLNLNGLDDKETESRLYQVTVGVYQSGAAQDNFPEDDRIVVLEGAKED